MIANYNIGNYVSSSPAVANGYAYVGGYNNLYQLNASNVSQLIANYNTGNYGSSSPVVANGFVYSGSYNRLYQLNASNISQQIANFTYTTGYFYGSSSSSPAVANGYVYVASNNKIYQLNASNVSQEIANYTYTTGYYYGSSSSSPAVANGYVYIASYNKLFQLNASNIGQEIANYTYSSGHYSSSSSSPAVANGYVYLASNNQVYQFNASNVNQMIANYNIGNYISSSPAVANGYLYIGSYDKKLYQLNASNVSQVISTYTTGSYILSSPAVANGYVYVGSYDKKLYQLNGSYIDSDNSDITAPTIIITTPANNSYVNGNVTIEAIASDFGGINNVLFEYKNSSIDYTTLCLDNSSAYSCIWETDLFSNASEGYDIKATATDNSNNNASQILHLTIDWSIPLTKDITITYPIGQTSIRNGQTLIGGINTTDSAGSGINTTIVNTTLVNDSGNTTMVLVSGNTSSGEWSYWNKSIIINASTGNHQLPIYVFDNSTPFNLRNSDRFYVIVDNDVPTYSEFQDYGPVYNEESMIFRIKVADNYAASSYIFSTNMSGSWVNDSLTTISDPSEPIFVTKTGTTGNHSYRFYIFDDAGNVNITGTNSFEVYGNRPEFTILMYNLTEGATSNVSNVNFTYKYINGIATNCSLYIDSAINLTTDNPLNDTILEFNQTFAEGTYQWYVGCIEDSTNNSYSGASRIFSADWEPVWSPEPSNQMIELGNAFSYDVNATDLQTITYAVNDTANFTISSNTGTITNNSYLNVGVYGLNITATDLSGNVNYSIISVTVRDITRPVWAPEPSNQITELGNAFSYDVNATDLQTITYGINDSQNFSINATTGTITNNVSLTSGIYGLNITATDASSNVNTSSIIITVSNPPPVSSSGGSGGGGSGGSGVITTEPLENIVSSERNEKDLAAGKSITYTFNKNQDIVYEVSVTGKENEFDVTMRIEILKDISKQVTESALGIVYRNVNIILGTKKVGENLIKFKVKESWLVENGLESADIRLAKWVDNKWITLETGVLFNKDGYTHFSAKSMTFSIYAITGIKKEESMPEPLAIEKIAGTYESTPLTTEEPTPQPDGKIPWLWMILAVLLIAALVYAWKKR
ncbi:MAG: PQQ-binding-like beta-propeller repeat protein [Candidatus Methanoperedens sp.]|nr:PQQ-binding-like beta-propeller repeat protein [Candidatus Methanoperedens sp.]